MGIVLSVIGAFEIVGSSVAITWGLCAFLSRSMQVVVAVI